MAVPLTIRDGVLEPGNPVPLTLLVNWTEELQR